MKKFRTFARIALPAACILTMSLVFFSRTIPVLATAADSAKHESAAGFWKESEQPEQDANTAQEQSEQSVQNTGTPQDQLEQNTDTSTTQPGQDTDASTEQPGQSADTSKKQSGQQDTDSSQNQPEQDTDTSQEQPEQSSEKEPDDTTEPDNNKPETATHVSASVKQTQNTQSASISWKSVPGALTYKVQRSDEKNGTYKNIASLSKSKTNYIDKSIKRGSKYYYRVAAKLKQGGTCYSDILSFSRPLAQVSGVSLVRYSTSSIKVVWDQSKDQQTEYYKVYYAKSKTGTYKLAGTTKNTWYRVKDLANNQDYYFRVKACAAKKASNFDSVLSKTVTMRTMTYNRTTLFAGDSLMSGLRTYNILNEIAIGGNKGVVAAVGLNTITFRTRRVFDGKSGVESIISAKPYRVYIMLGDNDIHYRQKEDVIAGYREILKGIRSGSPNTDIVVLAATPVTSTQVAQRSGFAQIPAFNKSLEALAKSMGARYYDCTAFLKDSTGWLKTSYAAGDGIHWKASAYHEFGKLLEAYDKSLD